MFNNGYNLPNTFNILKSWIIFKQISLLEYSPKQSKKRLGMQVN